ATKPAPAAKPKSPPTPPAAKSPATPAPAKPPAPATAAPSPSALPLPSPLETYLVNRPLTGRTRDAGQLRVWAAIWQSDPDSRKHGSLWFNAAIGGALAADPAALEPGILAALERHYFNKHSYLDKKYFPDFATLAPWEMRFLTSTDKPVTEVDWCQRYLAEKKPTLRPSELGTSGNVIPYRLHNKYDGKEIYIYERERDRLRARATRSRAYYDYRPETFANYIEYGGVCVEISTIGRWFAIAKGLPALNIGQPSHLAFIWRAAPHQWRIGNNIHGWHRSTPKGEYFEWDRQPAIILLFDDYMRDPAAARRSCIALWKARQLSQKLAAAPRPAFPFASAIGDTQLAAQRLALLREGLRQNPFNYELWRDLADALDAAHISPDAWETEARTLLYALREHPLAITPLLERYTTPFLKNADLADATVWLNIVADTFAAAKNVRAAPLGAAAGYAKFFALVAKHAGLPERQANQAARMEVHADFWKRTPEEKHVRVDALFRRAIEATTRHPTLATSVARSYFLASRDDPARGVATRRYLENLFKKIHANDKTGKIALAISRLIILGAEEVGDIDAVALNTFYALQIQLEAAPTNAAPWRDIVPTLLANATLSRETRLATERFLRQVADAPATTPYNAAVRKHAADALKELSTLRTTT
ncbi:MAG: hypothetical protein LBT53_06265, partial [Puniceicoccales bacterium]|nr:hypothetical protein [Puniceicoccales bacterium]